MGGFGISVLGIIVKMALWSVPMMRSECKISFVLVSQLVELVYMLSIRVAVFIEFLCKIILVGWLISL